jgi:hypothetical protein
MYFTIFEILGYMASQTECFGTPMQISLTFIEMGLSREKRDGVGELDL